MADAEGERENEILRSQQCIKIQVCFYSNFAFVVAFIISDQTTEQNFMMKFVVLLTLFVLNDTLTHTHQSISRK